MNSEKTVALFSPGGGDGPKSKKKNPYKSIISGGLSGAIEICITMPTEYVKTQMQLYPQKYGSSVAHCVRDTVKNHGVSGILFIIYLTFYKNNLPPILIFLDINASIFLGQSGLWRGLGPLVVFAVPKNAVRFFTVEMMRNKLRQSPPPPKKK